MKIKIITSIGARGIFLGHDEIEEDLNTKIELWLNAMPRKNPRVVNSTVFVNTSGDYVYQVHIAHD